MMDDNFTDYFEPENVPDDKPKEETPEQREEREIKETTIDRTRGGRRRLFLWSLVVVLAGFLVYTVWSRYIHPYRTDCQERGVIMDVANEGTLVKTYECKMISEKYISDTVHIYTSDFAFTIKSDSLAREANALKGTGRRVTVHYYEYKGMVPWRGETKRFATQIVPDGAQAAPDSTGLKQR